MCVCVCVCVCVRVCNRMLNGTLFFNKLILLFTFIYLFILFIWLRWVFVAAPGLFSGCGEWGLLFVAVRGFLIVVASLIAEHGL